MSFLREGQEQVQTLRAAHAGRHARAAHGEKFTNGADREVVVKLYTNVAERCIYPGSTDYYGMSFGDEEMKVLCEWFPKCEEVERWS